LSAPAAPGAAAAAGAPGVPGLDLRSPRGDPLAFGARDLLALLAVLALSAVLRFARLEADFPAFMTPTNAEVMDGPWYLAEAADDVRGQGADVPPQYRKPVFTALARAFFAAYGAADLRAAIAFAALGSFLVVVFGFLAARLALGTRPALLAALLLATSPVLAAYARAPVVYGWLAALMAAALWLWLLGLRRGRGGFFLLGWGLLAVVVLGLKETAIALAPALAAGHVVLAREPARAARRLAIAGAVGAAGLVLGLGIGPKLLSYLGPDVGPLVLLKRLMNFPMRSRLFSAVPIVSALAWGGVLLGLAREAERPGEPGAEARARRAAGVVLAAWLVATIALGFPFGYDRAEGGQPPLRYVLPASVPLALLAVLALERLRRGFVGAVPGVAVAAWAVYGGYVASAAAWTLVYKLATDRKIGFLEVLVPGAAIGAVVTAALAPRLRGATRLALSGGMAAVLVGGALGLDVVALARDLGKPRTSLRDANREMASILGPRARVIGNWAHALTADAPHARRTHAIETPRVVREPGRKARLDEPVAGLVEQGYTHLAMDIPPNVDAVRQAFAAAGAPLELVAILQVRDAAIFILRFPWAEEHPAHYRLSDFESGRRAALRGDADEAARRFEAHRRAHPGSALACLELALLARDAGRADEADRLYEEALERYPGLGAGLIVPVRPPSKPAPEGPGRTGTPGEGPGASPPGEGGRP